MPRKLVPIASDPDQPIGVENELGVLEPPAIVLEPLLLVPDLLASVVYLGVVLVQNGIAELRQPLGHINNTLIVINNEVILFLYLNNLGSDDKITHQLTSVRRIRCARPGSPPLVLVFGLLIFARAARLQDLLRERDLPTTLFLSLLLPAL